MLALTLMCLLASQNPLSVAYELTYDPAQPGLVGVTLGFPSDVTVLVMPRAIPMGYDDVHYDHFVHDVEASSSDGTPLAVTRESEGPRWKLGDGGGAARRVRYTVDVDAMEREIVSASDTSKARPGYVGLLGYSIFAYAEGLEGRPVGLTVSAPDDWPVFLTLAPRSPTETGIAKATAVNFYALADSQVAMGPDLQVLQLAAAVPLFLVQYAEQPSDASILGIQAVTALNALAAYFGSVPFPHYSVHVEFLEPRSSDHRYGFSMEHMESCTIFFDTTRVVTAREDQGPGRHLYNLAHHMAHSWIPKRAAPAGYFPWSWELSPVLDSIWFSEGWGQYAGAVALAEEAGLGESYRKELVDRRFRASLAASPSFLTDLDLVDVSRIASTRYSEDFRTGRNVFSRGGLMAYEMDEAIRKGTDGKKSLRDLLQLLMEEGRDRPLDLDRLPELCLAATGTDVSDIYRRWLDPLR